jgi:hypothetical protein
MREDWDARIRFIRSLPQVHKTERPDTLMPFSVEVHHSLMDGLHVDRYIARIEEMLAQPELHLD